MNDPEDGVGEGMLVTTPDAVGTAAMHAELDQQITTARAFPRSLKRFRSECLGMATLTEAVAEECLYAIPRGGKIIEGPSVRLAEIVASAWGNCQAGARVIDEGPEFVTAQGAFFDLEKNVRITMEVRRRITDRDGRRYGADMIAVTGNAACAVALRNAVFKGVPKAFWADIYKAARECTVGNLDSLVTKRAELLGKLQKLGVTNDMVFAKLGVEGLEDITRDHVVTLAGLGNAIKEGEATVEAAFGTPAEAAKPAGKPDSKKKGVEGLADRVAKEGQGQSREGQTLRQHRGRPE